MDVVNAALHSFTENVVHKGLILRIKAHQRQTEKEQDSKEDGFGPKARDFFFIFYSSASSYSKIQIYPFDASSRVCIQLLTTVLL